MASETGDDSEGSRRNQRTRRFLAVVAVLAVAVLLAAVSLGVLQTQANCDVVEHYPNVDAAVAYADGSLTVTHDGGERLDRRRANRTSVVVRTDDGERARYPLPTESAEYPLTAGDAVTVEEVTVDGRRLRTGDGVTVRYEKHVDFDPVCVGRSDHVDYLDGELAANGTVA